MPPTKKIDLAEHLAKEHKVSPFSTYLREIVYGGIDGIITTFAVVAGFTGAQAASSSLPALSVLLFGFANLFADAASMGLGNFLSVRSDQDVYKSEKDKERYEIKHSTDFEKAETMEILQTKGFSKKDASTLTQIYAKNEDYWVEFMMQEELEMSNPEHDNPLITGITTFVSFIIFGFIPLMPYLIMGTSFQDTFLYSISAAFGALILLGILRWKVANINLSRALLETLITGGISAVIAYFVGTFFSI